MDRAMTVATVGTRTLPGGGGLALNDNPAHERWRHDGTAWSDRVAWCGGDGTIGGGLILPVPGRIRATSPSARFAPGPWSVGTIR